MEYKRNFGMFMVGSLCGAWVVWLTLKYMVWQEFYGLEMAGNNNYINLHNQLFDVFGLFPLVILGPATIIVGFVFIFKAIVNKRKNQKVVLLSKNCKKYG